MRAIGRLVRAAAAVLRSAAAPVVVLSLLPAVTVNRFAGTIPRSAGAIPAPQARDDRPWNRAYRDGLEQLKEGRFVEAERSFRRALAADRAPAERNRMVVFDNIGDRAWFLPEYYLAVTLLNQRGKEEEALRMLQAVQRDRRAGPGTKEAGDLPTLIARAQTAVAPPPAQPTAQPTQPAAQPQAQPPAQTPAQQPAQTPAQPPTQPPAQPPTQPPAQPPTQPPAQVDPLALLKQGRAALAARRYPDARAFARDAGRAGATAAANALTRDVDAAERLDVARAIDDRDRAGMAAFFAGNYKEAIRRLEDRLDGNLPGSPRTFFYLACANAALALMPGEDANQRQSAARRFYGRIGSLADVERDMRYVSPRVREALGR